MKKEIRAFNIKIHPFTKKEFIEIIELNINEGRQIVQNGVNASSINDLTNNNQLLETYNKSNLINIDGMSMVWALRFLGHSIPERVACPDLALEILKLAERQNYSVFLLGAKDDILELSVNRLKIIFPKLNILGCRNGYFHSNEEHIVIDNINILKPDILFLGMPSPKKELFIEKYKNELNIKYSLGVGGFFDILSGRTRRAPIWLQNIGMEWFFRFLQEPRRMWPRYIIGNFKFIRLVFKEKRKT